MSVKAAPARGMTDRQLAVRSMEIALAAVALALYCIGGHTGAL